MRTTKLILMKCDIVEFNLNVMTNSIFR